MQEHDQRLTEGHNTREVYKQNKKQILLLLVFPFSIFIATLLFNLPVSSGTKALIEDNLLKSRQCPLIYKKFELDLILPTLKLDELTIPGRCFGNPKAAVHFNKAEFGVTFPSFWPIGIKTKFNASFEDSQINVFPRLTIAGHSIQIANSKLTTKFINQLTPQPNMINGDFDLKGNIEIKGNDIDTAHLLIDSNNLFIPTQNVSGIQIPALPLKKFELAANIVGKQMQIKALRIGSPDSTLQGEFKGTISLSKANIAYSKIDLQGKIKISKEIQEALPLIRLLLNGKNKKDGFYFITLGGTLGAPQPKIVDPQ